ncbi:hypothetical protein, partial [Micromonospora sp. MW-13]|uniref:hypothetical protein n=1 Tax=Micromonospora sp. MW-13 TaxID=2094022 RepID=UPI001A9D0641
MISHQLPQPGDGPEADRNPQPLPPPSTMAVTGEVCLTWAHAMPWPGWRVARGRAIAWSWVRSPAGGETVTRAGLWAAVDDVGGGAYGAESFTSSPSG